MAKGASSFLLGTIMLCSFFSVFVSLSSSRARIEKEEEIHGRWLWSGSLLHYAATDCNGLPNGGLLFAFFVCFCFLAHFKRRPFSGTRGGVSQSVQASAGLSREAASRALSCVQLVLWEKSTIRSGEIWRLCGVLSVSGPPSTGVWFDWGVLSGCEEVSGSRSKECGCDSLQGNNPFETTLFRLLISLFNA